MTRSTPHRGWMLWGVLLVFFLLVPALLVGCSDNKGSKGPSYGSSITGTATGSDVVLTITANPNAIPPGGTTGITVTATTINGAPLANRDVVMETAAGTLSQVSGKTDAAGKFVTSLTVDVKETASTIEIAATVMALRAKINLNVLQPGTLAILPGSVELAPGATQVFQASGGVEPYRWEVSGGTLNTSTGSSVTYTAGSSPGTFALVVRDAAGNSASVTITISLPALTLLPEDPVTRTYGATGDPPGTCSSSSIGTVTITFTVTGGVPPYTFSATYGTVTPSTRTTPGDVTYSITPGALTGGTERTEYITVLDSARQSDTSTVTIKCVASTS